MNPGKMEKEPESLAVQMKSDYASSEVYSTAGSEAPPAYKMRQANSVKIAKIIAGAIIVSTFMLGCFILATTYMQNHAVCDQIKSLEDALDKEMMLEIMSQQGDLPKAAALQSDDDTTNNVVEEKKDTTKAEESNDDVSKNVNSEDESAENNEIDDSHRFQLKLPMDIDLNQIATNFMKASEKSKMNCVVEKRKAEELINPNSPFDLLVEQKKTRITGERLAIICESNVEPATNAAADNDDDKQEIHIRQFIVPIGPQQSAQLPPQFQQPQMPIPYGAMPNMPGPLTHMPMRMMPPMGNNNNNNNDGPQNMIPHPIISRLFVQARPMNQQPIPAQIMQAPPVQQPQLRVFQPNVPMRSEMPPPPPPQVRIQLHRISVPEAIEQQQQHESQTGPQMQLQQVPLAIALEKAGITPEDLNNIRKIAEVKFQQEMNRFMEADSEDSHDDTSEQTDEPTEATQDSQTSNEDGNILPMGRLGFARSLLKPVNIPVQMMPQDVQENEKSE